MTDDNEEFRPFTSSAKQWETLKPFARTMRHLPTAAEQRLWERLRNRGVGAAKFRRQHAIDGFIVDFVCIEHKIIIEVDGSIHDDVDQKVYDETRQQQLEERGFRILRFCNDEVFETLEDIVEVIRKLLVLS